MSHISKTNISSPIEAGVSLLQAKQLPPQLNDALEYVSSRLARKRLHLDLVISPIPNASPSPNLPPSPAQSLFSGPPSPRHLGCKRSVPSCARSNSTCSSCSSCSSPSISRTPRPSLPLSPKAFCRWPTSPSSSASSYPMSPTFPQSRSPTTPNYFGISLKHFSTITPKAEKILRETISKAERKFPHIGTGWLSSQPGNTAPINDDLIRRSLIQNEVVFSSEGLTLLSLDRIYTFKLALQTYSRILSPSALKAWQAAPQLSAASALKDAVDELRRLVLAQSGRGISKGYLLRAYDHLSVSVAALSDVHEAYKSWYGGPERKAGIEMGDEEHASLPALKTTFGAEIKKRVTAEIASEYRIVEATAEENESIQRLDQGPHRRGPCTPNGFEDITPVTRGEWCFLMVGDGWKGRSAGVETC